MHVSICIVAFRNAPEILHCLHAVAGLTHDDFDVVICENGGAQAHAELTRTLNEGGLPEGLRYEVALAPGNLGYAGGVNLCIRARPGSDAWWVLNPDTKPEPEALTALLARLARGDCHAVGSTLYHPDGKVQGYGGFWRGWLARAVSLGMGQRVENAPDAAWVEGRMNYIMGAAMLVDRHYVATVGLMRDDYFLYCEEVEWSLRGIAKGMRPGFAPDSRVLHGQGGTTESAAPVQQRPRLPIYMDERNKLNVIRDTMPGRLPVAMATTLVLLTLRYARQGAWKQWRYALAGWWAGIQNKRGMPPWLA